MRGWTAVIGCREEDRGHHQRCGPTSLSPYLPESSPYIDGRLGHTGKGKVQKSRGGGDGWGGVAIGAPCGQDITPYGSKRYQLLHC